MGLGRFLCYGVRWWRERQAQRVEIAALVAGTHDHGVTDATADSGGLQWDSGPHGGGNGRCTNAQDILTQKFRHFQRKDQHDTTCETH